MGSKTCTYMLRTLRLLQPCGSSSGMSFYNFRRNYRLEAVLPLGSPACSLRSVLGSAPIPIRCISQETSQCNEARTITSSWVDEPLNDSSDVNHVSPLNEHSGFKPDELASRSRPSSTMIALDECTTTKEVLNVLSRPLNRKDELFKGVQKLWLTFLELDDYQKPFERVIIIGHPNFHNLMEGVRKLSPTLSPGALVFMLYVFVRLKVNQQSKLIQNLLLLCQKHLSSLNEEELAIMANTLEWLRSDRNVDLLKFGLRLLIDMNIEEFNGVMPLLTMMKTIGKTAPLSLKSKFENKVLQMVDSFNVEQSENIFCIFSDINLYAEPLLDACSRKLIDGIDEVSYTEIVSILSCCCELNYTNERLLQVFGDQIMKSVYLFEPNQVAMILHYFTQLRFRHVPLLDRYADIFVKNIDSVKIWDLTETTTVYSALNHLPEANTQQFLEAVKTCIAAQIDSIPPMTLLDIVYHLCGLGVCPAIAVHKLLQSENVLNFKEHSFLMQEVLCLMRDEPFSNSYSLHDLKKVPSTTSKDIQTFHTDMKSFIKDPELYEYSVQIANAFYIDFILALDTKENKLVPVGDMQTDDQQEVNSSENITRIAVLCCTPNVFALGTLHPLGKLASKIRNIKAYGFSVVLVPVHTFVEMTEEQRLEFLRTNIFHKISDRQNALEVSRAMEDHKT